MPTRLTTLLALLLPAAAALAATEALEVSDDGLLTVRPEPAATDGLVLRARDEVPYGAAPDWQNTLRMQVGGLQVADMDGDGRLDVVVGCYHSNSYPPYDDWFNMIYFNTGTELEAEPSWQSADEVSTGDIQVGFIDGDPYPDVFAANGGSASAHSVIYWGGPAGPDPAPGWYSAEPGGAWNNYALLADFDRDGDTDIITANQGFSEFDAYRPLYAFLNDASGVPGAVPAWSSAEQSLQGFLALADWDGDGWDDLAVSKWVNFESGVYRNEAGVFGATPAWTTGDDDSDKGVAWADVDGDDWPDLALGHDPTQLFGNDAGVLSPVWTSGATYFGHSDIRFADVDRDGDPDLAETHFSDGKVHIYLNDGGVLAEAPSWTYDSPSVGTAIAFGDINGDGWVDLVVGNSGEPCVKVFYAAPVTAAPAAGPSVSRLLANHPNPFNPATTIPVELAARAASLRLSVHDVRGRRLATLARGPLAAGRHDFVWRGTDDTGRALPAGVYLARLELGGATEMRRLVLLK